MAGNISPDPIDIALNYTLQQYLEEHEAEIALLLNPYFDDPKIYFAYEADDTTEEVIIVPTKAEYANRVKAAEKFYGINRIELKNVRYSVFRTFRLIKKMHEKLAIEGNDEPFRKEVKKQIDAMLSNKYLFAGMNRYFNDKL